MQTLAAQLEGGADVEEALNEARTELPAVGFSRLDYLELADEATLTPSPRRQGRHGSSSPSGSAARGSSTIGRWPYLKTDGTENRKPPKTVGRREAFADDFSTDVESGRATMRL